MTGDSKKRKIKFIALVSVTLICFAYGLGLLGQDRPKAPSSGRAFAEEVRPTPADLPSQRDTDAKQNRDEQMSDLFEAPLEPIQRAPEQIATPGNRESVIQSVTEADKAPAAITSTDHTDDHTEPAMRVAEFGPVPSPNAALTPTNTAEAKTVSSGNAAQFSTAKPIESPASQAPTAATMAATRPITEAAVATEQSRAIEAPVKGKEGKETDIVSLGQNPARNVPSIQRIDDDTGHTPRVFGNEPSAFIKTDKAVVSSPREQSIQYVYLSRGAWLIKSLQPFIDRLGIDVLKSDSAEVTAGYVEVVRSYAFLCALVASDDGSEAMLKSIGSALAGHRRAVSTLRLQWVGKSEALSRVFQDYVDATFLKNVEKAGAKIPAGSLSADQYKSLKEVDTRQDKPESAAKGDIK